MEEIESYAPYEDGVKEPIKVSVPSSSSKGKGSGGQQEGSLKVITVGGGGEDPFEVLGEFG